MDFNIRDINQGDIDELSYIFADAYRPEKTGEHWTADSARNVVEYWFKRSPSDMKILAQNKENKILGAFMADIKPWWDGPRMIDGEFFVSSNAQGNGIGKELLKTLIERAIKNYKANCFETLTFMPDEEHPLKWYLNLGFEKEKNLIVINGNLKKILDTLKKEN